MFLPLEHKTLIFSVLTICVISLYCIYSIMTWKQHNIFINSLFSSCILLFLDYIKTINMNVPSQSRHLSMRAKFVVHNLSSFPFNISQFSWSWPLSTNSVEVLISSGRLCHPCFLQGNWRNLGTIHLVWWVRDNAKNLTFFASILNGKGDTRLFLGVPNCFMF